MFGENGRIGVIVPANNSVLEPELGTCLPPGVALYATRILAKGDLTPEAVIAMESEVGILKIQENLIRISRGMRSTNNSHYAPVRLFDNIKELFG